MGVLFLHSDSRVLDLIRKGEEEALMILYKANRQSIVSYVIRNHGTREDGEDMLQEALTVLWERVRAGRFEYSARLSTFLYATVKNIWMRQLARRRREPPIAEGTDVPGDDPSPLELLIKSERAESVRDALRRLGDPCRKLLLLFYWEEKTMEEIAAAMGFANAETAKSKKYQCKEMLKKLLMAGG